MKILDDCLNHYMSLKFLLFPFLAYRNLIEPFKTDKKNIDNINKDLLNFSKISKDNRSALNKVISKKNIDLETAVNNIKSFLVGGIETSARWMSSIIYYIAKYPKWYEKLVNELKACNALNQDGTLNFISKEVINSWDYLSYVIKEALRIDPPAVETVPYKALQDVKICGIPIPKDSIIAFNQLARHYNPEEWSDPHKFIPERFDPTSPLFNKPKGDSKSRDSISFSPFSFGMRSCPGLALAMLEIKIGIITLLSKFKFEVDQDLIENESTRFSIGSNFKLKCKIYKR